MPNENTHNKTRAFPPWSILLLAFLSTAAAHGCLVLYYGSPLPFWDEWDGIGLRLFLPFLTHRLSLHDLFSTHNEHRVVLTRLQSLALLTISGRWDIITEMTLNCVWYGLSIAVLVGSQLRSDFAQISRWAPVFTVTIFSLPFGFQNATWGFESQNYFPLLFAAIAFSPDYNHSLQSRRWWIMIAACFFPLFSSATGILISVVVIVMHTMLCALRLQPWQKAMPTLIATGAIFCLGFYLRKNEPSLDYLEAKTFAVFLRVMDSCLAWPNIDQPLTALVAYLPVITLVLIVFLKKRQFGPQALMLVWAPATIGILQALAIAYERGNGLPDYAPLSRYQEILAVGATANFCALLMLKPAEKKSSWRPLWTLLCISWCTLFVLGAIRLSMVNFEIHLPFKAATNSSESKLLTSYAQTHDPSFLAGKSLFEIGYTDARTIQQVIDNSTLAPVLPTMLQLDGKPTRIESGCNFLLRLSPAMFLLSFTLLLFASIFGRREVKLHKQNRSPEPNESFT